MLISKSPLIKLSAVLRTAAIFLLFSLSAVFLPKAYAGYWQVSYSYDGRVVVHDLVGQLPIYDFPWPWPEYGGEQGFGYGGFTEHATSDSRGNITVTLDWIANPDDPSDVAPPFVYVQLAQSARCSAHIEDRNENYTFVTDGTVLDDGLGDLPILKEERYGRGVYRQWKSQRTQFFKITRNMLPYTYEASGMYAHVDCRVIDDTGQRTGNGLVASFCNLTMELLAPDSKINFYHATLLSVVNQFIDGLPIRAVGTADFGKGFYALDEDGYSLARQLGERAVINWRRAHPDSDETKWGVLKLAIPIQDYFDFRDQYGPSIVDFGSSTAIMDPAPANSPPFTSTDPADQPNDQLNVIPVGPMNWYNFCWYNWWLYRRLAASDFDDPDLISTSAAPPNEYNYFPAWLETSDEIPNWGRPMIIGRFFNPKRWRNKATTKPPLGEELEIAYRKSQFVWNTMGISLLNDRDIVERSLADSGEVVFPPSASP